MPPNSLDPLDALRLAPFHLNTDDVNWVRKTRDSLSMEDKLRQLFVLVAPTDDVGNIERLMAMRPGGVHRMVGADFERAWQASRRVLELSEIPPFLTGDLEGGAHSFDCITALPNPLGLAAAADLDLSREVVGVMAQEAKALGFNWSFTPVADINQQITSAIVGTRSFGSDVETILAQTVAHVQALQAEGIAATAKHWPGEGFDARDQHLVTTINPLSLEEWDNSFGRIYRAMIDAGVMTVMSAHIALPAWARKLQPDAGVEAFCPASLSHALNTGLLRNTLGFNGLIASDATLMAGMGSWVDRATAVPQVIESGCDVFLFSLHEERDYALMLAGLREGRLSERRVEEAVTRILGLKAALGLHRKSIDERIPPLPQALAATRTAEHMSVAQCAASRSITLVKDVRGTLPLTLHSHHRVVIVGEAAESHVPGIHNTSLSCFKDELRQRGFELRDYDPAHPPAPADTDLLLYLLTQESMLTLSRIYVDWRNLQKGLLPSMERYWHDVPTIMVSFGHPYHLYDAPRVPTYINAYSATEAAQIAVVRKLLGEEAFTGKSPVDAFCGLPDAIY